MDKLFFGKTKGQEKAYLVLKHPELNDRYYFIVILVLITIDISLLYLVF